MGACVRTLHRFSRNAIRDRASPLWWQASRLRLPKSAAGAAAATEMKTLVIIFAAFVATAVYAQHQHGETKQLYTCPMHPEIVRAEPGKCPKCGMTLVPVKESKRSTSNAQHPTSKSEHAKHNADGMAMPAHEHAEHAMEMHSSINIV